MKWKEKEENKGGLREIAREPEKKREKRKGDEVREMLN